MTDTGVDHGGSRRRPALADLGLAACLLGIGLLTAALAAGRDTPGSVAPDAWWKWLVVAAPAIAVAWRRVAPLACVPFVVGGQILIWVLDIAEVFAAPLLLIYTLAALGTDRYRGAAIASATALTAAATVGISRAPDVDIDILALTVLSCATAYILGSNVAQQQAAASRLAADLAVARFERDAEAERVALHERARIARELHDLVGHSLSMIAVRAEAGERVATKRPEAALETVQTIGETARSSLAEVRRVLFALRRDSAGVVGDDGVELAPVPGLDDLAALVERTAEATGRAVHLELDEAIDIASLDRTLGSAVYRIVQEALTNTLKHAGPDAVASVAVTADGEHLAVEVSDDGRPSAPVSGGRGTGIAGMRERATILGGTLEAGIRPEGGFVVQARLPVRDIDAGEPR